MTKRIVRRRKRGPVVAKKVVADGIQFQSGLEKYMYMRLKEAKLFEKYEGEKFEVMKSFELPNQCLERQANGKGEMQQRSMNIRNISYTPDFTGKDYIIETKGRANESFPLRWKMFKQWLYLNKDTRMVFKPQKKSECDDVVEYILKSRDNDKT